VSCELNCIRPKGFRVYVCAGKEDNWFLSVQQKFAKIKDIGKANDPKVDEAAPEVIIDSAWIFQPKNKDVLNENA